jgi:hypothetical protein
MCPYRVLIEPLFSPLQYNSPLLTNMLKSELRFFEHLDSVFFTNTVTSWGLDPIRCVINSGNFAQRSMTIFSEGSSAV